ncbi:MAG TPA: hypothetical protein VFQ07_01005 [Candidatus Polarisedimenticolia bacterium]|nr:hypothetical protein [Candidatus Polarisedimenticolia bacterium]
MGRGGKVAVAAGLAAFVAGGAFALAKHRPLTFLVGDGPYYAATAVSILHDHDLDLRNQLRGGLEVHGRQIALGQDGAWYPKHPILMPVTALPFLALFGMDGFLVFNLVVLGAVAAVMTLLARRHAAPGAAAAAVAVLLLGTFFRDYVYNLSPDLFATLLFLLAALAIFEERFLLAGLALGGAVAAKVLLVVLVPVVAGAALASRGLRGVARLALGLAPAAVALLVANAALFGSPWVTSYDRGVSVASGQERLVTHRTQFDGEFGRGLWGEISDPRHGILPTAPVVLLAVPGLLLLGRRNRREAVFTAVVFLALLGVLAPYREWTASHAGNRFLMPAIALLAPAMALACSAIAALRHRAAPAPVEERAPAGIPAQTAIAVEDPAAP